MTRDLYFLILRVGNWLNTLPSLLTFRIICVRQDSTASPLVTVRTE